MTLPTKQQRVRLLVHAAWDMRDDGLSNQQMIQQLQTEGVPAELAAAVPNLVDEAIQHSAHDQGTREQRVQAVEAAVKTEDFDAVQIALAETLDDDRTIHKAYQKLTQILEGPVHETGTVAAYALSMMPGIGDWALILALDNPDANVRYRAAFALGKMGSDANNALPELKRLKSDPDEYVRDAATEAIGRIKPWWKFW